MAGMNQNDVSFEVLKVCCLEQNDVSYGVLKVCRLEQNDVSYGAAEQNDVSFFTVFNLGSNDRTTDVWNKVTETVGGA